MDISAKDLNSFVTISRLKNITAASSKLGITQPALTRTIKKLESELGVDLFIRSKKGVTLTKAGQKLLVETNTLLQSFSKIENLLASSSIKGSYNIGVHLDLANHTLPKFLGSLLKKYPEIEINIVHDFSRNITKMVNELTLDFGIVVNPFRYPEIVIKPLYYDEVGFWVAKNNSFDLNNVPIICNTELPQTNKLIKVAKRKKYFRNSRIIHTTSLNLIANLAFNKCGVGITPKTVVDLYYKDGIKRIKELGFHKDSISLIFRKDKVKDSGGSVIKDEILNYF